MSGHRRGMSLIEALISLVIVGTMAVAGLAAAGHAARTRAIGTERNIGGRLSSILLDEVVSRRLGTEIQHADDSEDRSQFASIDDYDGYRQSPPRDLAGVALEDSAWSWSVEIDQCNAAGEVEANGAMRLITVRVSHHGIVTMTTRTMAGGAFAEAHP